MIGTQSANKVRVKLGTQYGLFSADKITNNLTFLSFKKTSNLWSIGLRIRKVYSDEALVQFKFKNFKIHKSLPVGPT